MKILVTTDFSANSKAGMRYAISLAKIMKAELCFLHSYFLPKPSGMADTDYPNFARIESEKLKAKLEKLVEALYKSMGVTPGKYKCIVIEAMITESSIMDYSENNDIDFICMSTRGAGKLKKFFGSTAGNMITKSNTPVIVVPKNYKFKPIENVLYASDLKDHKREFKKVMSFAKPLNASVEIFHLTYPGEKRIETKALESSIKKQYGNKVRLHMENTNLVMSLTEGLQKSIKEAEPELVIMFTEQRRSFFQKLFLSSASEQIAFETKVPMLVFNKTAN